MTNHRMPMSYGVNVIAQQAEPIADPWQVNLFPNPNVTPHT